MTTKPCCQSSPPMTSMCVCSQVPWLLSRRQVSSRKMNSGAVIDINQASMNHQEIANGVANSLDGLSEDIAYWNNLMQEHGNTKIMRRYVRELYVVVFEFLTEIFTKWSKSSWKR